MTRGEELTLKLLEGAISEEEMNELEWLIASNRAEAQRHTGLLELEGALRGRRRNPDLARPAMLFLREALSHRRAAPQADPLTALAGAAAEAAAPDDGLPDVFGNAPPPSVGDAASLRRRRRRRTTPVGLYIAFFAMVALVIAAWFIRGHMTRVPPKPVNQAAITQVQGRVTIDRGGRPLAAAVGSVLSPGNIVTTGAASVATLEYDRDHTVKLRADSRARLDGSGPDAPQQVRILHLERGQADVNVIGGSDLPSVRLITPFALVTTSNTRYTVQADNGATVLRVHRGSAIVDSSISDETVTVKADERVRIEPGLPLVAAPADAVERVTDGLLALYLFTEGSGAVVHDFSRVEPVIDLKIADPRAVSWGNRSLKIAQPTSLAADGGNAALIEKIQGGNAISIEAWIEPINADQSGPATILSLGTDPEHRLLMLGQGVEADDGGHGDRFVARLRTVSSGSDTRPGFQTDDDAARAELTHVVYTRDASGVVRFYLNGLVHKEGRQTGGLTNWATEAPLTLANEATGDHPWLGTLRLVAIFNRSLTGEEVAQNHAVGLIGPGPTKAAPPTRSAAGGNVADAWREITMIRQGGSDRSQPFTVDAEGFRIRLHMVQPADSTQMCTARLRDVRDDSRAQELLSTDRPRQLSTIPAAFGAGEYVIETLAPDQTDWEFRIEVRGR